MMMMCMSNTRHVCEKMFTMPVTLSHGFILKQQEKKVKMVLFLRETRIIIIYTINFNKVTHNVNYNLKSRYFCVTKSKNNKRNLPYCSVMMEIHYYY